MKIKIKILSMACLMLAVTVNGYGEVAKIASLKGTVEFLRPPSPEWSAASVSFSLERGDRLKTGADGEVSIAFTSGHTANLGPKSDIAIKIATADDTRMDLFKGKLRSKVKKLSKNQGYEISTPQAVCAVRGTEFEVSLSDNMTSVKVFEGIVQAREMVTGESVNINAGQYSNITKESNPTDPQKMEDEKADDKADKSESSLQNSSKEQIRNEMFEEISRDAVLSRAAEEIKRAEYENGKAMIDAHGNRVRLEEYVVRPEGRDNEFKYVVLNERKERFDFGKINFEFNKALPEDLTDATAGMFYSKSAEKPDWILTELLSVMSNTKDLVKEDASGGDMLADANGNWNHYFGSYEFSIKGQDKAEKILWEQTAGNTGGSYEDLTLSTVYLEDPSVPEPESKTNSPSGTDAFHRYTKDTYSDGTWISAEDYLIDDEGDIQTSQDLADNFSSGIGGNLNDYLAKLNFERKYESSEFDGRDIDLVFSTKLLLDSGMISMGVE